MEVVLIDADQFMFMKVDSIDEIEIRVKDKIKEICGLVDVNNFSIVLSSKRNKRKEEFSSYKLNRKDIELPPFYREIKQYLIDNYNTMEVDGEEADDIIAYFKRKDPDKFVIASQDKDLLYNFPGTHVNTHFRKMDIVNVDTESSDRFFYTQMLVGDKIDNIPRVEVDNKFREKHGLGKNRVMSDKTADFLFNSTDLSYKDFALYCYLECGKTMDDYFNQMKLLMLGYEKIDIELTYNSIEPNIIQKNLPKKDKKENMRKIQRKGLGIDNEITFGKHKGITFNELYEDDKNYFDWLYGATKNKKLKKVLTEVIEYNNPVDHEENKKKLEDLNRLPGVRVIGYKKEK